MHLVTREQWGSQVTTRFPYPYILPMVFIHHTAGHYPISPAEEVQQMHILQNIALNTQKISDIAYNFLIGPSGTIYESRGALYKSAATLDQNEVSRSICFMGNYMLDSNLLTEDSITACIELIKYLKSVQSIALSPTIYGHRENPKHPLATSCPGDKIMARMDFIRKSTSIVSPPVGKKGVEDMPFTARVDGFNAVFLRHGDGTLTWVQENESPAVFAKYGQPVVLKTQDDLNRLGVIIGTNPGQV